MSQDWLVWFFCSKANSSLLLSSSMQWNLNQIKMCGASSLIPSLLVNCTFKAVWQSPPTSVVNCPWKALRGVDNKIFTWIYNFQFTGTRLLRFSKTRELWSSKAAFTIKFFAAVNHNSNRKQRTLNHRNTQNGPRSTNHKSENMTFWTHWSKLLFPKRSAKIIDSSEKGKRLACLWQAQWSVILQKSTFKSGCQRKPGQNVKNVNGRGSTE